MNEHVKRERVSMGKSNARVRNWLVLVAVGLLFAAICFAVSGSRTWFRRSPLLEMLLVF